MGRPRRGGSGLSVGDLFNEAQRGSASSHIRYSKALWENVAEDPEGTYKQLVHVVKLLMTVAEKTVYQERLVRFLATFVGEVGTQEQLDFVEPLIAELAALSYAKDPTARWRACQLLQGLIVAVPSDADLSNRVADTVQAAMLERLEDARPAVRAAAVRALTRLPDPGEDGQFADCPVVATMLELLETEKNKDVRKAVMATLPACAATKPVFLERTRDEADEVRRVTYLAIADKVPIELLSKEELALLIQRGLGDRARPVADAARRMLEVFLEGGCGGGPLVLLQVLDVEQHSEESEAAIRALVECGNLRAVELGKLAAAEGWGLRADFDAPDAEPLSPDAALFWRVICECLNSEATSKGLAAAATAGAAANIDLAVASDRLEALEAALPPTVEEMARIIDKHAQAGSQYRFVTGQLMLLAARCMDFTDATGRAAASQLLQSLLTDVPGGARAEGDAVQRSPWHSDSGWRLALALFLRKVYGSPAELADALLGVLGSLHVAQGFGSGSEVQEAVWLHTLAVGALMLEQLSSARSALAASSPFTLEALLHELIQPGLRHASPGVRAEATRCLGLYCLLSDIPTALASHVAVLRGLLASDEVLPVKAVAAMALGDLAAQRGAKEVDRLLPAGDNAEDGPEDEIDTAVDSPLLKLLLKSLADWQDSFAALSAPRRRRADPRRQEEAAALGVAVAESLARLLLCNCYWAERAQALDDGDVVEVLVRLVLLNFDEHTEAATRLHQALPVFFEAFAHSHASYHQCLATALLPAAEAANLLDASTGQRITAANSTAVSVVRFVGTLLLIPVRQPGGELVEIGHEALALALVEEAGRSVWLDLPKPYIASLCKLAASLRIHAGDAGLLAQIRDAAVVAQAALSDRAMAKDLGALYDRLLLLDPSLQLGEEQINALLGSVKEHEEGPPQRPAKTPATKVKGGRRRKAASPSDSSEEECGDVGESEAQDESDGEGEQAPADAPPPTATRRNAARSGRASKRLVESAEEGSEEGQSDDEESTDSPVPKPASKVQRMRPTPFNKKSGVANPAASRLGASDSAGTAAADEEEPAAGAKPAAAARQGKAAPKRSLAARAARKNSQVVEEDEEEEEEETSSPVPKPASKVQRMRPTPFNKKSGVAKPPAGGKKAAAAKAAPDSSSEGEEEQENASDATGPGEESLQVVVRVRPPGEPVQSSCLEQTGPCSMRLCEGKGKAKDYTFDHVCGESSSQQDVFEKMAHVVDGFLDGFNATVMAYGQTGSGKTHTMQGRPEACSPDSESCGIIQRTVGRVLAGLAALAAGGAHVKLRGSYLELYNDRFSDLLAPATRPAAGLKLREVKKGIFTVSNLTEEVVASVEQALELLRRGVAHRRVAATQMNDRSSRSHAIFTLALEVTTLDACGVPQWRASRLRLVDLAGSERAKRSGAEGDRLREAANINSSLSALSQVISALVDCQRGKAVPVPYRNSRLTQLLCDSLGGNSRTCLVATISPCSSSLEETASTLLFASNAKQIKTAAKVNAEVPLVASMQQELGQLQAQLAQQQQELGLLQAQQQAAAAEWETRLREAQAQVAASGVRASEAQAQLAEQQRTAAEQEVELLAARGQLEEQRRALAAARQAQELAEAAARQAQEQAEAAAQQAQQQQHAIAEGLEQQLAQARGRELEVLKRLAGVEAERDDLRMRVAQLQQEAAARLEAKEAELRVELEKHNRAAAAHQVLKQHQRHAAGLQREAARLREDKALAAAELGELRGQLAAAQRELEQEQGRADRLESEASSLQEQLAAAGAGGSSGPLQEPIGHGGWEDGEGEEVVDLKQAETAAAAAAAEAAAAEEEAEAHAAAEEQRPSRKRRLLTNTQVQGRQRRGKRTCDVLPQSLPPLWERPVLTEHIRADRSAFA
eukprot:scaffold3.g6352.t1